MTGHTMELLIQIFEYIGIFTFAISGAIAAMRERMDIFGIYCIAIVSALGGGVLRDVIAANGVPAFFSSAQPVLVAMGAATLMMLLRERVPIGTTFVLLDAWGLAVFVVSAGVKGIEAGYNFMLFMFVAVITGVGGGILRDLLCGHKPDIFRRDVYTLAGILGAVLLWNIYHSVSQIASMSLAMTMIVSIRMACYCCHLNLPTLRYKKTSPQADKRTIN